jgi:hypothetical protein
MLERAYNWRDSTYWLLGLYIESDLQIINGVRRRKKPWRLVSMMLHGESKERWSVSMDQPLK